MKLVYFDFIHNLGGAQMANIKLLRNIMNGGHHDGRVVSIFGKVNNLPAYAQNNNVVYDYILDTPPRPFKPSLSVLYIYLSLVFKTVRYFKQTKTDTVFTSSEKGLYYLTLAKLLGNRHIKIVYYSHGYDRLYKGRKLFYFLCRRFVSRVWVLSPNFKDILIKNSVDENKIDIIPNFIELANPADNCTDIQPDATWTNVLLPGSVIKAKGVLEAIMAFKILKEEQQNIRLYIAGATVDEKFLDEVRTYIEEYGLGNNISILGWRGDILCIMKKMSFIMLPSYSEGMPLVVLEAMALGKMAICSQVGALPNIIDNGRNGLLLADLSPQSIANSIKEALKNDNYKVMGANAQGFVAHNYNKDIQRQKVINALAASA